MPRRSGCASRRNKSQQQVRSCQRGRDSSHRRERTGKRRNLKDAIKETKNKLHQVGGAYQEAMHYARWLEQIKQAPQSREVLREIMRHHASTRERLPILDSFYPTIFSELGEVHSVLDVACGLNPLAIPWMPLPKDATYHAFDIYADMMQFIGDYMRLTHIHGTAAPCDVLSAISNQRSAISTPVDVAFVLKTIPCLEQVDKAIGPKLLDILDARFIVVSFPIQSLGGKRSGRGRGMLEHYANHFADLISGKPWRTKRLEFESELVFIIRK
ncbi:MAG: 16S rRNA methyltransferase [Sphingomonadales bacterium]|nr:16S rRNA methyltransferase [Sphingomonadales bacterium]